jgi:hypothetical protein
MFAESRYSSIVYCFYLVCGCKGKILVNYEKQYLNYNLRIGFTITKNLKKETRRIAPSISVFHGPRRHPLVFRQELHEAPVQDGPSAELHVVQVQPREAQGEALQHGRPVQDVLLVRNVPQQD